MLHKTISNQWVQSRLPSHLLEMQTSWGERDLVTMLWKITAILGTGYYLYVITQLSGWRLRLLIWRTSWERANLFINSGQEFADICRTQPRARGRDQRFIDATLPNMIWDAAMAKFPYNIEVRLWVTSTGDMRFMFWACDYFYRFEKYWRKQVLWGDKGFPLAIVRSWAIEGLYNEVISQCQHRNNLLCGAENLVRSIYRWRPHRWPWIHLRWVNANTNEDLTCGDLIGEAYTNSHLLPRSRRPGHWWGLFTKFPHARAFMTHYSLPTLLRRWWAVGWGPGMVMIELDYLIPRVGSLLVRLEECCPSNWDIPLSPT